MRIVPKCIVNSGRSPQRTRRADLGSQARRERPVMQFHSVAKVCAGFRIRLHYGGPMAGLAGPSDLDSVRFAWDGKVQWPTTWTI